MTAYKVMRTEADGKETCMATRKAMDDALDVMDAYKDFDRVSGYTPADYRIQIVVEQEG